MIGMSGSMDDISESHMSDWNELQALKSLLQKYLALPSSDGRIERKDLRKQLCETLCRKYDTKSECMMDINHY
jgi:hypothetical protein